MFKRLAKILLTIAAVFLVIFNLVNFSWFEHQHQWSCPFTLSAADCANLTQELALVIYHISAWQVLSRIAAPTILFLVLISLVIFYLSLSLNFKISLIASKFNLCYLQASPPPNQLKRLRQWLVFSRHKDKAPGF